MNLTNQVRSIALDAEVTRAVVGAELTNKIEADARSKILELKETVNWTTESFKEPVYGRGDESREGGWDGRAIGRTGEGDKCWRHVEGSNG
jgi:hypothetical protein